MKYLVFLSFTVLCHTASYAQSKQDYNWLFGREASPVDNDKGYIMNFNTKPLTLEKRDNGIGIAGYNASISDKEGNLLFYSNGCAVLNRDGDIMPNGADIVDTVWMEMWKEDCKYGYSGGQNIMILPDPGNEDEFYLINRPKVFNDLNEKDSLPLWYNKIDMTLDNGKGNLTVKNVPFFNEKNTIRNYLTAINHKNGKDWWVLQPIENDSVYLTFLIDENGITRMPDQNSSQYFDKPRSSASGTSKFSPDGGKYSLYNYYDQLHIYDFDRSNGLLTNHQKIFVYPDPDRSDIRFSSVEWSPNGRFIYVCSSIELFQIDTWESDIQSDGIRLIAEWNGTQDPFSNTFYLMAQAPDCKIYMCSTSANNSYHVIKNPDELGQDCNFCQSCLPLPEPANFGSMPNFPRFRVDEAEKCDSTIELVLGLPVWYERELTIYPNPSNGTVSLDIPEDIPSGHILIFNTSGQIIEQHLFTTPNKISFDLTGEADGIYYIEIIPDTRGMEKVYYRGKMVKSGG